MTQGGTGVVSKSGGLRYVAVGVPNVDQTELEAIQTSDGTVARWADLPGSWGIPSVGYPTAGYGAPGEGLRANRLLPGRIADRTQRSWVMQGSAVTRTTSEDGRWVYTLYTNPGGYPFVHALDTVRGVAHCIGLPMSDQGGIYNVVVDRHEAGDGDGAPPPFARTPRAASATSTRHRSRVARVAIRTTRGLSGRWGVV